MAQVTEQDEFFDADSFQRRPSASLPLPSASLSPSSLPSSSSSSSPTSPSSARQPKPPASSGKAHHERPGGGRHILDPDVETSRVAATTVSLAAVAAFSRVAAGRGDEGATAAHNKDVEMGVLPSGASRETTDSAENGSGRELPPPASQQGLAGLAASAAGVSRPSTPPGTRGRFQTMTATKIIKPLHASRLNNRSAKRVVDVVEKLLYNKMCRQLAYDPVKGRLVATDEEVHSKSMTWGVGVELYAASGMTLASIMEDATPVKFSHGILKLTSRVKRAIGSGKTKDRKRLVAQLVTYAGLVMIVILPPIITGVVYGLIPLGDPKDGVTGNYVYCFVTIPIAAIAASWGLIELMFVAFGFGISSDRPEMTKRPEYYISYISIFTISVVFQYWLVGTIWRFPTPFGYVWFCTFGVILATANFLRQVRNVLPRTKDHSENIDWNIVIPLVLVTLIPVIFIITFAAFRSVFSQLTSTQQVFFNFLWPGIEQSIASFATTFAERGSNPDIAPFLMFTVKTVSGIACNFIFADSVSAWSILPIVAYLFVSCLLKGFAVMGRFHKFSKWRSDIALKTNEDHDKALTKRVEGLETSFTSHFGEYLPQRNLIIGTESERRQQKWSREIQQLDDVDKENDDDEGEGVVDGDVSLLKGMRELLMLCADCMSTMSSCIWTCIILTIVRYGPNQDKMYGVEGYTDADYYAALQSSAIYFSAQAFSFGCVCGFIKIGVNINAFYTGLVYVRLLKMFWAAFAVSTLICFASFAFYIKHAGCDPKLKWSYD